MRGDRWRRAGAAVAALMVVAGVSRSPVPAHAGEGPPVTRPADIEAGRSLFEIGCSSCHGLDAQGGEQGPSLIGVGAASADFQLTTGRMPASRSRGQQARKPPAYSPLEIRQLVAYVASLGSGPPIPTVDLSSGDLSTGFTLYANNCASCHSSAGAGGALGHAVYAPGLHQATPVQVAEAMRVGPGAMPVFGPETFDADDVASIVRYVQYLRDPRDRGGAALGHLGPIPEGFVAWVVGLGLMLLACRWIGTRE